MSPGFLCCRNSDVTVVIRRKVVGIDLQIWRPEKFYNSVTLFAVRPIIIIIIVIIIIIRINPKRKSNIQSG